MIFGEIVGALAVQVGGGWGWLEGASKFKIADLLK